MEKQYVFVFVLIILFLFTFGCSKTEKAEKPEWKGKIEIEEGVKVVKNPKEPLYGDIIFNLEEELSIGREDDDNYLFYRASDIALDSLDNIYVLEYGNCRIQKFDKSGNYLQTIGRKGQGPGEFEAPIQVLLNDVTETIYVRDRRKIKIFDKDGNFIRDFLPTNYPFDVFLDTEGNIYGKFSKTTESGPVIVFDRLNSQGEKEITYDSFPTGATYVKSGEMTYGVFHDYSFDLHVAKIDDQTFIYGYSKDYEINVINKKGDLLFTIQKEEPYLPVTGKEKDSIRGEFENIPESVKKAIQFPPHKPFYGSLFCDSKGRIYVYRLRSPLDEEKGIKCDIFSKDGYFLYQTILPSYWPYEIREGYFYTKITSEETGSELIKRFRIKNWQEIKEGIS